MKYFIVFILIILTGINLSFAVYTRYINDFKFENIEYYEFSNVTFIDNSGIELSRDYNEIFSSSSLIWSIEKWGDGFLAGCGDSANLLFISEKTNKIVFSSSNQLLFSDIELKNNFIYLSTIPKGIIFKLDNKFTLIKENKFNNEYIWQMIPYDNGILVLTGNPAVIYYLNQNDEIEWSFTVNTEHNLLKGIIISNILYFSGESGILYRLDLKTHRKSSAVLSFDNAISDFIYQNGKIYIITSSKEIQKPVQNQSNPNASDEESTSARSSSQEKRNSRQAGSKSVLYSFSIDGNLEELLEKNNIRFISICSMDNSIIIGCDKNAGYYELSLTNKLNKFSSLGSGKFVRFITIDNNIYAILQDPSRIVKINSTYAREGYFISSAFDTGNISSWGNPLFSEQILPLTDIKYYTRSGAIDSEKFFDEWQAVKKDIKSYPNRFIQYKAVITSDGKNTPQYRGMIIPFLQKNIAPAVDKITINYSVSGIKAGWDASDENKDFLIYDVYLAQFDKDWIKINDKPLEENSLDIAKENFPEGRYRLKVVASDERSNPSFDAKTGFKISDGFYIDNSPPVIIDLIVNKISNEYTIQFSATDVMSPLAEASYSINGAKWVKFLPKEGMFDSQTESFVIKINLNSSSYLQIKVSDFFGNYSTMEFISNTIKEVSMAAKEMRIGILTSGGDCPGLNAAIRGVGKASILKYGMKVYGISSGFQGLINKEIVELDERKLSGILTVGGHNPRYFKGKTL